MTAFALDLQNVNKLFNSGKFNSDKEVKSVLNDVNLQIRENSIFGLAGLNGVGKTTMIKLILDLLSFDSGKIFIFGIDNKIAQSRQNICYLPEKFQPSQYLTGYEFLDLSLSFYNKKLDKQTAYDMALKLDFDPNSLKQIVRKYSKGMGQKLGLMSCLLSDAKLLILDEPMTGLDPKARVALKETLKEYVKTGKTIFFSSHILDDIEEICDEIAILHDGKILFHDTPSNFMKEYNQNKVEKAFLMCIDDNNYIN